MDRFEEEPNSDGPTSIGQARAAARPTGPPTGLRCSMSGWPCAAAVTEKVGDTGVSLLAPRAPLAESYAQAAYAATAITTLPVGPHLAAHNLAPNGFSVFGVFTRAHSDGLITRAANGPCCKKPPARSLLGVLVVSTEQPPYHPAGQRMRSVSTPLSVIADTGNGAAGIRKGARLSVRAQHRAGWVSTPPCRACWPVRR